MSEISHDEYMSRLSKLQRHLRQKGADAAIFNVNSDLYYYTGSVEPLYLIVPGEGEALLLARKAIQRIRNEVAHIALEPFSGSKDLAAIIGGHNFSGVKKIGLTLDSTTYATVLRWQQVFGGAELVDISMDVRFLRMVKSETEIAIQARAAGIMAGVPELVRTCFRPGMTELELSAIVENYFRLNRHGVIVRCRREGIELAFGVCSAGTNSLAGTKFDGICGGMGLSKAVPLGANDDVIPPGVPIIMDFGFNLEGYHMDQTRMFSRGEPPAEARRAYEAMLAVEERILEILQPGRLWSEIYDKAVISAAELGYEQEFMEIGRAHV
jgi:Xaa-Pro dipeptidase